MPAPLSVVIPTLNAAERLPATLAALIEGLEAGLVRELVISDGGSGDATLAIADEVGAVVVSGAPGRGGQLARGAVVARAPWILFLHADTVLPDGWSGIVSAHIARSRHAGYFALGFDRRGLAPATVAAWANLRSRFGLPYGDQGLLVARHLYDAVGGYDDVPLMEDVALVRRLAGRLERLPGRVVTDGSGFARDGWFRRGARNLSLLARYLAGADPERLARDYYR